MAFAFGSNEVLTALPRRYCVVVPIQRVIAAFVGATRTQGHFKVGRSLVNQFAWNNASECGGWNADVTALRRVHPGLLTLDAWVRSVDWVAAPRDTSAALRGSAG